MSGKLFRLNVTYEPVRALLDEWKRQRLIPVMFALTDGQRREFEVWAITVAAERGIDVFGNENYRRQRLFAAARK